MKNMICCCCGNNTKAKIQWWNQDNGYCLCKKCYEWIQDKYKTSDNEMKTTYGIIGIHCAVE